MEYIIDWEILDNEEACNSITPLGVGNLGGKTPIVLVGDRNTCDGSGSCDRLEHSTPPRRGRDEIDGSLDVEINLDDIISRDDFNITEFEDIMEIWNYDYGGS